MFYCGFCGRESQRPDYCEGCKQPGKLRKAPEREPVAPVLSTGMIETDVMFGGGLRRGSVYLLFADPGAGKSTIVSQWAHATGGGYLSTEQSPHECERLFKQTRPKGARKVAIVADKSVESGIRRMGRKDALYVDSISGMGDSLQDQKKNVTLLVEYARELDAAVVAISHVNKSGELAGLKAIEHMVDGVVRLEGSRETRTRRLVPVKMRNVKPRSVGLTREDHGFSEGYQELLALDRHDDVIGSVLCPVMQAGSARLAEVCAARARGTGKVLAEGVSEDRVKRLLAVVAAKWPAVAGPLRKQNWTVSCDVETSDPQVDAAIVAAMLSAITDRPLPAITMVWGAVPLVGQLRPDDSWDDRRDLAQRLPVGSTIAQPFDCGNVYLLWEKLAPVVDVVLEEPETPGKAPGSARQ